MGDVDSFQDFIFSLCLFCQSSSIIKDILQVPLQCLENGRSALKWLLLLKNACLNGCQYIKSWAWVLFHCSECSDKFEIITMEGERRKLDKGCWEEKRERKDSDGISNKIHQKAQSDPGFSTLSGNRSNKSEHIVPHGGNGDLSANDKLRLCSTWWQSAAALDLLHMTRFPSQHFS